MNSTLPTLSLQKHRETAVFFIHGRGENKSVRQMKCSRTVTVSPQAHRAEGPVQTLANDSLRSNHDPANIKLKPPMRRFEFYGRGDMIRTCDILLPKQALYQTELRPETNPLYQAFIKMQIFIAILCLSKTCKLLYHIYRWKGF